MTYDQKSWDLAKSFLFDYKHKPNHEAELAQIIQDAIEDYLNDRWPHVHKCQQCDKVTSEACECAEPGKMTWCSATCKAAFDR